MAEAQEQEIEQIEEKDDDLVMVGDGVDEGEEQRLAVDQEEEGHPDDDTRLGGGEAEEDERREARRIERKSRRQRQKDARDRDQRELKFLRQRNEQVERQLNDLSRRVSASETSQIDQRISQLNTAIRSAEDVYAKAIDAGEGKDAAEAQRIRDSLRDQVNYLEQYKSQGGAAQEPEDAGPDPRLVENVRDWHSRNEWFDFSRRDEDSAIAGAIDDRLAAEGWDPTTPEYYDELDRRLESRLPHLYGGGEQGGDNDEGGGRQPSGNNNAKPRGPKFRVAGKERALKSNEVHISRERREAMEEAGVWDDPVLRKKYLKRYAEWDKANAGQM